MDRQSERLLIETREVNQLVGNSGQDVFFASSKDQLTGFGGADVAITLS